jgi:hypothetical protein
MKCPRCLMHGDRTSASRRAEIDQLERLAHAARGRERFDEAPEWEREEAHYYVHCALNFPDAGSAPLSPETFSLETFNKLRDAATALGIDVAR